MWPPQGSPARQRRSQPPWCLQCNRVQCTLAFHSVLTRTLRACCCPTAQGGVPQRCAEQLPVGRRAGIRALNVVKCAPPALPANPRSGASPPRVCFCYGCPFGPASEPAPRAVSASSHIRWQEGASHCGVEGHLSPAQGDSSSAVGDTGSWTARQVPTRPGSEMQLGHGGDNVGRKPGSESRNQSTRHRAARGGRA